MKHKTTLSSWDAGKAFQEQLLVYSNALESKVDEREDTNIISNEYFEVSIHFDTKGTSFVIVKSEEEQVFKELTALLENVNN